MSNKVIRAAFESAVAAWASAQSPAVPVVFENADFTPPVDGSRYARAFLLPAPTESSTLDMLHRGHEGVFQLTLCMPKGKGSGSADDLAASLEAAISPASPIVRSGVTIHITRPMSASPGIQEDDCYAVPVSCSYRADTYPS